MGICAFLVFWRFLAFPSPMRRSMESATGPVAVGISLAATYGTVSIRHDDGSFTDIGRVEGDAAYTQMMERLSLPTSSHPAPPYSDLDDMWNDKPRQSLRSLRKLLFLPASSDVRILSTITSALVGLVNDHISSTSTIGSVVITSPALPGLFTEDISDAADYLSLPTLSGTHGYPPRTIVASYAGHGMGLCSPYHDRAKCEQQGLQFVIRPSLLVDYSLQAFFLHAQTLREAYDLAIPDLDISTHFFTTDHDTATSGSKKQHLLQQSVQELLCTKYKPSLDILKLPKRITVLLTGDITGMEIMEVVKTAVEAEGFEVEIFSSNTVFIAARGAAELAWRALALSRSENVEL